MNGEEQVQKKGNEEDFDDDEIPLFDGEDSDDEDFQQYRQQSLKVPQKSIGFKSRRWTIDYRLLLS